MSLIPANGFQLPVPASDVPDRSLREVEMGRVYQDVSEAKAQTQMSL